MLDWNSINTVFLDMDGTLLDLHYDNYFWLEHLPLRYAQLKGVSAAETARRLSAMYQAHQGSLNWYCVDFWSEELTLDIASLKREVRERIGYRPNAQRFLQYLLAEGYDVALVTNAHRKSIELKLEHTDLASYIPEIICAHDFKLPKEAQDFWQALSKARHFDPSKTAFFDDNEAVLHSAKAHGIAYLFSIAQPDSQRAPRTQGDFPLVNDFQDILPRS